jgi:hypothetical protein
VARSIRVNQIGDYVQNRMEQLLRVTVLETDSRLKQASPVDTGRFRASWQVGENAAPGGQVGPGDYGSTPALQRIGYSQERVGNVYSVHNNLPYAERLAQGWSQQAPAGWVQGIAKDMQQFVRVNAAKIGRES